MMLNESFWVYVPCLGTFVVPEFACDKSALLGLLGAVFGTDQSWVGEEGKQSPSIGRTNL